MQRPRVLFVGAAPLAAGGSSTASVQLFRRLLVDDPDMRYVEVADKGEMGAELARVIDQHGPEIAVACGFAAVLLLKQVAPELPTVFLAETCRQGEDLVTSGRVASATSLMQGVRRGAIVPRIVHQPERRAVLACDLLVATTPEALELFEYFFPTSIGKMHCRVVSSAADAHFTALLEAMTAPGPADTAGRERTRARMPPIVASTRTTLPVAGGPGLWERLGRALQLVPLTSLRSPSVSPAPATKVGVVVWRYPMLSQTFVQGEVRELRRSGVAVEVIAEDRDDPPIADEPATSMGGVTYLGSFEKSRGRWFVIRSLCVRPLTVTRLWLLLIRHQYPLGTWWSVRNELYAAAHMASVLRQRGVTHVHAAWADGFAMHAFIASRMLGLPFSVQARASEVHRSVHRAALLDRIRFAAFIVTNTHYNERYLRGRLGGRNGVPPVHVIHNGVDLKRFNPALRTRQPDGSLRLLSVGRMVEPKGFRYLLEAVALLRERGLDVRCDIIGAAEETATWVDIRMRWVEWHLQQQVRFLGARPPAEVIAALGVADMFVLPCVRGRDGSHDITPNALLEAMAMQLPVISTTSGAVPELVTHGVDGWLVSPNDAAALAGAIERLFRDVALAGRLGVAARQTVEQRFDLRRNVSQRVALFRTATAVGVSTPTGGGD